MSATRTISSPLRVAVFSFDERPHACATIRVDAPLTTAGHIELQWAVSNFGDRPDVVNVIVDQVDLFVIQRFFAHPSTADLVDRLFRSPLPVLYEIDDLLTDLPASNPHRKLAESCRPHVLDAIKRADLVTVSTRALEEQYRPINSRIRVLPNLVDTQLLSPVSRHTSKRSTSDPVTIGYTGTPTHIDDLTMIEKALCRVHERFGDRVRFHFMGCVTPRLAELPGVQLAQMELDYRRYAAILAASDIDIAVVPLLSNRFNRCKSNIKWLEYAACGIPAVFSDLPPYQNSVVDDETGILVAEDEDCWFNALSRLIDDPARRQIISEQARAEVLEGYSLQRGAKIYRSTYEEAVARSTATPTAPRCSIIIPVFNQLALTRDCLTALSRTTIRDTEVIVVNNGSSDGTAEFLNSLGDAVHVIHNEQNLGFAPACNQGAHEAVGKYLLFLNNDTRPLAGWLEPLLSELDQHPEVEIVGSKLIYSDGTIQHAGIAFSIPDAIPYHVYRGVPSCHPAVEERRELRAVTGACMLVRRALFVSLDGFDQGYRNGFEDVDFCLRAVESGAKIVYQPRSVVVHFEEQSEGRKDSDAENLARFLQSWAGHSFPDEVGRLLEDGFVTRSVPGANMRHVEPVSDAEERSRWEAVAELERKLAASGLSAVREQPPVADVWPNDLAVLRWGENLCTWAELPQQATDFQERWEALALKAG